MLYWHDCYLVQKERARTVARWLKMFWRLDCFCHLRQSRRYFVIFSGVENPRAVYVFEYVLQGFGVFDVLECSKFCRY